MDGEIMENSLKSNDEQRKKKKITHNQAVSVGNNEAFFIL